MSAEPAEVRGTFRIVNELGLHARAATKLVQLATSFRAEVDVEKDGRRANAKSIMGVLLLCGQRGADLTVIARGDDARAAVDAIGALVDGRFGEDK